MSIFIPLYSVIFLPPFDFLPFNDDAGNDFATTVFDDSDYNFIIITRNIDDLRADDFRKIAPLYQLSKEGVINLYLFTSSEIGETRKRLQAEGFSNVAVYNVDEVVLKSMIRHKMGVILVSNGVVKGKWNLKQNTFRNLTKEELPALVVSGQYIVVRYTVFLFSLISVLFYLVFLKNRKQKRKEREEKKQ